MPVSFSLGPVERFLTFVLPACCPAPPRNFCPGLGPRSSALALKTKLYEVVYAGAVPDLRARSLSCAAVLAAVAMPAAERQKHRAETRQIFSHSLKMTDLNYL